MPTNRWTCTTFAISYRLKFHIWSHASSKRIALVIGCKYTKYLLFGMFLRLKYS
nr:MAG TPA: hypothetical protein [Caudoviricetes sp.]